MRPCCSTALVAGIAVALVTACATGRPAGPPAAARTDEGKSERMPGWPEPWGIEFGLRCAAAGEDVRYCACVAKEVQRRWTPEQFRFLEPGALEAEVRGCRARVGGMRAE